MPKKKKNKNRAVKRGFHTLPNYLTVLRIALIPVFVWLFVSGTPHARLAATLVFFTASLTDFLDGWIARRWGLVTEIGIFLDQFADKLLVWSALVLLLFVPSLHIHWFWVGVILFRDLFITAVRAAVKKATGRQMVTSIWGKVKAAVQMAAVIIILVLLSLAEFPGGGPGRFLDAVLAWRVPMILIILSAVLALVSLARYLVDNRPALSEFLKRSRRQ